MEKFPNKRNCMISLLAMQDWYDLDREDQENIDEIIQEEEDNNDQEIDGDQKRKDNEEED